MRCFTREETGSSEDWNRSRVGEQEIRDKVVKVP